VSCNTRACLFMVGAMSAFAVNDACTKLAIPDVPAPQIMALRGILATLLLVGLAGSRGALRQPRRLAHPVLVFRTVSDVLATITYVAALGYMPIANASAIFQALPLVVTLGAAVFLAEPVGWRRWTAISVGFAGIIVIVRPGTGGFSAASLAVLASVVFSAARDLATRRMAVEIPSFAVAAVTSASVMVAGFLLVPFWGWAPVGLGDFTVFAVASVALALGYVCIVEAMRSGDMGFVAPFRYTILLFAIMLGFLIFDDVPDMTTLAGAAIVIGSGAYSLYRERLRGRRPKLAPASVH
jgi:drug/metabolite transporter (DMT)-like permease